MRIASGRCRTCAALLLLVLYANGANAQFSLDSAARDFAIQPNIVYATASGVELKLDVYAPSRTTTAHPVLLFFHGDGWAASARGINTKDAGTFLVLPYLDMGFTVLNVEYRSAHIARAPAAVEDGRCALRWTVRHAKELNVDPARIVVAGASTGGHLALMTGLLPQNSDFDTMCRGTEPLKAAAIVNWFGVSDIADALKRPDGAARSWIGFGSDRDQIIKLVRLCQIRRLISASFCMVLK